MGFLLIDGIPRRIEVSDPVLDRIADLLEDPPTEGGGFWLAGQLEVERDGVSSYPDPDAGHQRLWVSASRLVTLVYDRPLGPSRDRLPDERHVVVI